MKRPWPQVRGAAVLAVIAAAACTSAAQRAPSSTVRPATVDPARLSPAAQAQADSGRPPYTAADVHFMAGVVGLPPPAAFMPGWGPPTRARAQVAAAGARLGPARPAGAAARCGTRRARRACVPRAELHG